MAHAALPEPPTHPSTPLLPVALLGAPAVTWAGQPVPLLRRQTHALHYRLAADLCPIPGAPRCGRFRGKPPDAQSQRDRTEAIADGDAYAI
jgi:hypothetical protein